MANVIDILINAAWSGGPAVTKAGTDLRSLSNSAAASSIEMAAVQQSSNLLNQEMARLGQEVALGNLTVGEATKEYQAFAGSLTTVEGQAPKTSASIGGMASSLFLVTGAITAAGLAASKLYDTLKESAELELTERRFDRLATSIGTTGEALRGDIGIASRGLISDFDAMALGTDLLALGLAKSHDEAVRLANVSAQLGFDLNQLVLTLTNQTTMRFDALGVSVDGFEEKVEKLEDAGYAANEAFKLAFLEQAEEQIDRVGSVAETTAGQITQIETAWTQMITEVKAGAAETLGPTIANLAAPIEKAIAVQAAAQKFNEAAADDLVTRTEATRELREAVIELNEASANTFLFPTRQRDAAREALIEYAAAVTESSTSIQADLEAAGFEVDKFSISFEGITIAWKDLLDVLEQTRIDRLAEQAADADRAMGLLGDGMSEAKDSAADLTEELEKLQEKVSGYDLRDQLETVGLTTEAYDRLALALGGYANAQEYVNKLTREGSDLLQDNLISAEELEDVLNAQREAQQEEAEIWLDFQSDLTDISVREGDKRESLEADFEQRRTDVVARYSLQRVQEEEDFQRSRARAEAKLQGDLLKVQEDSDERQADLRAQANERLADLESDHLKRMQDIIDDANAQLQEAAGRLDAAAVAAITSQRKRALEDEQESYDDSRTEIQRKLDQQLEAEQEAAAERLADLKAFHDERQRLEDEDRAIRLAREQAAHDARIDQLDAQQQERLDLLATQADEEAQARTDQYIELYTGIKEIGEDKIAEILEQIDTFWDDIEAGVPSVTAATGGVASSALVGPNVTNLPNEFFQTANSNTIQGDINININGAGSPTETGQSVQDSLLELFGTFNR